MSKNTPQYRAVVERRRSNASETHPSARNYNRKRKHRKEWQ